jgi:arylsulfatase A-like enzyme
MNFSNVFISKVIIFFSLVCGIPTLANCQTTDCQTTKSSQEKSSRRTAEENSATKDSIANSSVRPNIILINLDDADSGIFSDELLDEYLPNIGQMAREGLNFTNCHVGTPLCGPSRTCLLRGQHAHRTGIKTNVPAGPMNNGFSGANPLFEKQGFHKEHIGVWMQRAGYRTMMIGKYLHGRLNPHELPGWDDLLMCFGGNYYGVSRYLKRLEPDLRRRREDESVYRTVFEADEAVHMIKNHAEVTKEKPQPFFLYIAPLAPHKPAGNGKMLQAEYIGIGKNIRLPQTPDWNEADVSDKPAFLQTDRLSDDIAESLHQEHRKRVVSVKSVDDMLGRIKEALKETGNANNTFIFFTSDHGYQLGHNRMIAKKVPYHRNTVVPLLVSGPGVAAEKSDQLLLQIDLVATFLDLANGSSTATLDGKSIKPLFAVPNPEKDFRDAILIQNWEEKSQLGKLIPACYASLRMKHQIYTEWSSGQREYYDLMTDPFQVQNKIDSVAKDDLETWHAKLCELKQGETTPIATLAVADVISKNTVIRGYAEDDQSVQKVKAQLFDPIAKTYWNGSNWTSEEPVSIDAKLANVNGLISNWSISSEFSGFPNEGQLEVTVFAVDADGNQSVKTNATYTVDAIEPETILKLPADDTTVASPIILFGTCQENRKLHGIRLSLKNVDSDMFWNGQDWQNSEATFFKRVEQERWHTEINVPPGNYRASASGLDKAGNYDSTPSVRTFRVK